MRILPIESGKFGESCDFGETGDFGEYGESGETGNFAGDFGWVWRVRKVHMCTYRWLVDYKLSEKVWFVLSEMSWRKSKMSPL